MLAIASAITADKSTGTFVPLDIKSCPVLSAGLYSVHATTCTSLVLESTSAIKPDTSIVITLPSDITIEIDCVSPLYGRTLVTYLSMCSFSASSIMHFTSCSVIKLMVLLLLNISIL